MVERLPGHMGPKAQTGKVLDKPGQAGHPREGHHILRNCYAVINTAPDSFYRM